MKNSVKISVLVLLFAAICATVMLGIFADDEQYTGNMDELTPLVTKVTDAGDSRTKLESALVAVGEYLAETPVDPTASGYADAMATVYSRTVEFITTSVTASAAKPKAADKNSILAGVYKVESVLDVPSDTEGYTAAQSALNAEALSCAELYLELVAAETVESTAKNAIAVNNLNAFLKKFPNIKNADGYADFNSEYTARTALHEAAVETNKQKMLTATSLSDYFNYATVMSQDFTESGLTNDTTLKNTTQFTIYGNKGSNFISSRDGVFTVEFGATDTGGNTYPQKSFPVADGANATSNNGIVVDFDFTTFGQLPPNGFALEAGSTPYSGTAPEDYTTVNSQGVPVVYPMYFAIRSPDGGKTYNVYANSSTTNLLLSNAITQGEWLHFTCIFDPDSFTFSLYCEYELLGTYPANYWWTDSNKKSFYTDMTYTLSAARFNASTQSKAEYSLDNLQIYQGKSLRDLSLLKMNTDESFEYYVSYMLNGEKTQGNRNIAYKQATDLLENYWTWTDEDNGVGEYITEDAKMKALVDSYLDFCKNDYDDFILQLREHYRDSFIALVEEWELIERDCSDNSINKRQRKLSSISELLSMAGTEIEKDEAFTNANMLYSQLQRELSVDLSIIDFSFYIDRIGMVESLYGYEKYYAKASDALANADVALLEAEGYEDFAADYEAYLNVASLIEAMKREANSKKIVACYDLISIYPEEEWVERYDYMNRYVEMIRAAIKENNYSISYPRTLEVIRAFDYMDDYFYAILQQMHIDELTKRLDFIAGTDMYIDKMGTCAYIERYLKNNDIDYSNTTLTALIAKYESVDAELALREEDYEAVLEQNAYYFINLVEKMRIADGYLAKRAIYSEAEIYAYALNARVEGVDNALRVYNEHTLYIEEIESSSENLIASVAILVSDETDTPEEIFAVLVDCYAYSLAADVAYEGVAEALEIFEEYRSEYDAGVSAENDAINASVATVGSLRVNCGVGTVIAVIVDKLYQ